MQQKLVYLGLLLMLSLASCQKHHEAHQKIQPAKIVPGSKSSPSHVILTTDAEKRLGIESSVFKPNTSGISELPTSAVLYDTSGETWVFVQSAPQEYYRERARIIQVRGTLFQTDTHLKLPIVTQGVAELYGAESGVGK